VSEFDLRELRKRELRERELRERGGDYGSESEE
jgi:hypothetical protein